MPYRLVVVVLLMSMLIQAITLGGHRAGAGGGRAALHALLHWAGLAHQHHAASETYAQDQSPDATQHVLMDGCLGGLALIPSWPAALTAELLPPAPPCARAERAPASPFLEALRRPPRPSA